MEIVNQILGLEAEKLSAIQMAARTILVFIVGLVLVRIAGIRTFGKKTTFDQLTALTLGTLLGNAIFNARAPFFPILFASLVLMLMHRVVAWVTFISHKAGAIIKGNPLVIIKNGLLQDKNMKRTLITKEDIEESIRLNGDESNIDGISEAYVERSGNISIIKKERT